MSPTRPLPLLLLLALLLPAAQATPPRPLWLHYPEPDKEGLQKPRYFWTEVEIPQDAEQVRLNYHLDDGGTLRVDGKEVPHATRPPNPEKGILSYEAEATQALTPGRHRVTLENINAGGPGGIICKMTILRKDGGLQELFSQPETWLCSREAPEEGGLDTATVPLAHGDLTIYPWVANFDLEPLFGHQEQKERQEAREKRQEKHALLKAQLENEENPDVSVEYHRGLPMVRVGDSLHPAILYSSHHFQDLNNEKFVRSLTRFRDASLNLQIMGVGIHQVWKGPGEYDFSCLDFWPYDTLALEPDVRLLFDIDCRETPQWWMDAHPGEQIVYLSPEGELTRGDNIKKYIAPSFASEPYQKDIFHFLEALVKHVESQPWGKRVFGYRFDLGIYMEWHYYGMGYGPDDSQPMRQRFHQFLREKYGTDQALQKAWGRQDVTLDTAPMAPFQDRKNPAGGTLYDPVKDIQALDTVRCITQVTANLLLQGDKVIKEACQGKKLVGNFYGYFFGMPYPAVGQHPYLEKVLDSPYVDFTSCPPPYGQWNRDYGQAQFSRGIPHSFPLRNKLHIMEADTRTHETSYGVANHCYTKTPEETIPLLARDFAQALCQRYGFWYFDFGQGWYQDPLVGEYLKKLRGIWEAPYDCTSTAQVAMVVDMDSVLYQTTDKVRLDSVAADRLHAELSQAGVAYDTILSTDLGNPALPDYQVYLFANQVRHTPALVEQAQALRRKGKTLLWLHHAGWLDEIQGAGLSFMEELTGFSLRETQWAAPIPDVRYADGTPATSPFREMPRVKPALAIQDPDAIPLLRIGQDTVFAEKPTPWGGRDYLATYPMFPSRLLQTLFQKEGIHVYCQDPDTVIYANQSYLGLHVGQQGGLRTLHLPRKCRLVQLLPEEKVLAENVQEYVLDLPSCSTVLLRME
ncbi:MAG: beta-galactosidase [Oligosphaeraceae bacterium]